MCDLTNEVLIIIIATKPIVYKKKTQLITLSLLLNNDASLLFWRWFFKQLKGIEPKISILNLLSPMTNHPKHLVQEERYHFLLVREPKLSAIISINT